MKRLTRGDWLARWRRGYAALVNGAPHVLFLERTTGATVLGPVLVEDPMADVLMTEPVLRDVLAELGEGVRRLRAVVGPDDEAARALQARGEYLARASGLTFDSAPNPEPTS